MLCAWKGTPRPGVSNNTKVSQQIFPPCIHLNVVPGFSITINQIILWRTREVSFRAWLDAGNALFRERQARKGTSVPCAQLLREPRLRWPFLLLLCRSYLSLLPLLPWKPHFPSSVMGHVTSEMPAPENQRQACGKDAFAAQHVAARLTEKNPHYTTKIIIFDR